MAKRYISKNKYQNKKTVALSVLLFLLLVLGTTLAYLTSETEDLVNSFTFIGADKEGDNDMKAELDEPNWDEGKAQNLLPGAIVPKDPIITNTSTADIDEWVGMRITFQRRDNGDTLSQVELTQVLAIADIDWNMLAWTEADANGIVDPIDVYYYNEKIDVGEATAPIFTTITIKPSASTEEIQKVKDMGGFNIMIEGAAVQGPYVSEAIARAEIDALFSD